MRYKQLLEERRSCRSFRDEAVDSVIIAELFTYGHYIKKLEDTIHTSFAYIDKGSTREEALSGRVGYNGYWINAPHYVALLSEEKPGFLENAGYMMEEFLLKTVELGLASCWLSIEREEELKEELGISAAGKIVALAAIGYPKKPLPYMPKDTSYREAISDFIYQEVWDNKPKPEELESRGLLDVFLHVRKAPSWKNHQPWRFIIRQQEILLCLGGRDAGSSLSLDAGIMKLYMENVFKDEGINASWKKDFNSDDYSDCNIPEDYRLLGVLMI